MAISALPEGICALIATYLEGEGEFFREKAGDIIIREVRDGKTYGNGLLHSFNDQPAVCFTDESGRKEWYKNGMLHRDGDLPAQITRDGTKIWIVDGIISRGDDKPAIVQADGTMTWFLNGKMGRENGKPAVVSPYV